MFRRDKKKETVKNKETRELEKLVTMNKLLFKESLKFINELSSSSKESVKS